MLPLEGITVVSLEHAIAAPFATRQLADLGARVIKVERPGAGDFARSYDGRVLGLSSHFIWTNRSKESVTLDLKSNEGMETLRRLIATADVFVQNLAPGATERIGCDFASLAALHPQLIVCDVSGYGQTGPDSHRKAYDLLIQAESGFLSVTGTPDQIAKAGCSIADIAAGMYAYSNILAAIIARGKTGKGQHIDVSMLEAMAEWMSFPLYYAFDGAPQPPRNGVNHATIFPYGSFETADGAILFGIQNEREWESFCRVVLQDEGLAANPLFSSNSARLANASDLGPIISAAFGKLSLASVRDALDCAGIANARINDMSGLWSHAQLAARNRWREVGTEFGAIPALLPPGRTDARMGAIPTPGEHTDAILAEIGMASR